MANKSKNISFRYDLERFGFVKTKEKLEKDQQVLDFLVNKYWWEHKVAMATHKDVPPISQLMVERPPKNLLEKLKPQKTFAEFVSWKRNCESEEEFAMLLNEAEESGFTSKEMSQLKSKI